MTAKLLPLTSITIDETIQQRFGLKEATVAEYAERMKDGDSFEPVVVFAAGETNILADGFHRVAAAKRAKLIEIACVVREGDRRAALLYSAGANREHGLYRTNSDKRKAVLTLLQDKEWSGWSDRQIAKHVGVSQPFVSKLRHEVSDNGYHPADQEFRELALSLEEEHCRCKVELPDLDHGRAWSGIAIDADAKGSGVMVYLIPYERDPKFYWIQAFTWSRDAEGGSHNTKKPVNRFMVRISLDQMLQRECISGALDMRWTEEPKMRVVERAGKERIMSGNWFGHVDHGDGA
jgi:hypothetical protein